MAALNAAAPEVAPLSNAAPPPIRSRVLAMRTASELALKLPVSSSSTGHRA